MKSPRAGITLRLPRTLVIKGLWVQYRPCHAEESPDFFVLKGKRGGYGEWSKEVGSLIGQLAEIASAVPERLGCCHGQTQAQGQYAQWARKHPHRESLREVLRCRHAALDRLLLRSTETFAGDPDHCRMPHDG